MDWNGARRSESFAFKEVDWQTFDEVGDYVEITGGSVELSALSDTKATCSFDFEGGSEPSTVNYARIYYSFRDASGEDSGQIPLGTFIVSFDTTDNVGIYRASGTSMKVSGTADGVSLLARLSQRKVGYPYTIAAGTDTIEAACAIIEDFSLRHNNPQSPGFMTASAHTFDASDSYLTVVNWLLSSTSPQYASLSVDAYGTAIVAPYVEPSERTVSETFADGASCIFLPTVSVSNDWQDTANEMWMAFEDDTVSLTARAYVKDGAKFAYNQNGHRLITADPEDASEVSGSTASAKLASLQAKCLSALKAKCDEIEHVEFTHAYVRIAPGDAIALSYAGESWTGNVTNMAIELAPGVQTRTKMRRFISNDLTYSQSGWINWQA